MASFIKSLSIEDKLDILTESARYDVCLASCNGQVKGGNGRVRDPSSPLNRWIYPASVPGGGKVHMLKVLMSNICINNCSYCFFGSRRNCGRRTAFTPEELASVFMKFYRAGEVNGLFLSSGIKGGAEETMAQMVKTASLLRYAYSFPGYIHLKILPGVSRSLVEEAVNVSNRISLNLEAPSVSQLSSIAPEKEFKEDLLKRMDWTGELIRSGKGRTASQTTQFVVGPSGESDLDILKTVDWVYRERHVFRSYFSAFQDPDAPLRQNGSDNTALLREHRLYQCDFLLRAYGFRLRDLVFDHSSKIPLQVDPKQAWALVHPEAFPVDINRASEAELLRVPGIGPLSAERIVAQRENNPLRYLDDLKKLGAVASRSAGFIEFSGKRADSEQPLLFEQKPPEGWQGNHEPLQPEKVTACDYDYPAQRGKTVNYLFKGKNSAPIFCR
jgi:predicted DNA-binding helix-hairpin-helix protein